MTRPLRALLGALGMAIVAFIGPIAGYLVKQMSLVWLRWLVVCVVLYAAAMMLGSALRRPPPSDQYAARATPTPSSGMGE